MVICLPATITAIENCEVLTTLKMHQKSEGGRGPSRNEQNVAKVVEHSSKEDFS